MNNNEDTEWLRPVDTDEVSRESIISLLCDISNTLSSISDSLKTIAFKIK